MLTSFLDACGFAGPDASASAMRPACRS